MQAMLCAGQVGTDDGAAPLLYSSGAGLTWNLPGNVPQNIAKLAFKMADAMIDADV